MPRRQGTSASCVTKRNPHTLDAYVQVAIDANTPVIPTTTKKSRRRRKKNQQDVLNQSPPFVEIKLATTPIPAKPKRRKRKCKFKCYEYQDEIPSLSCKLRDRGLLTPEELEDDDEVEELQEELFADFGHFGELESLTISREEGRHNLPKGDVIVTFRDPDSAFSAFCVYNGKVFGGSIVTCFWETQGNVVVVKGMLTLEELEDPDEVADVEEEMMQFFRKYGEVKGLRLSEATGEVTVDFVTKLDADKAVNALNGSRYGGREVAACLKLSSGETHIDTKAGSSSALETKRVATPIMVSSDVPELQELAELLVKRLAALQVRSMFVTE
ncbi:hypothetical protein DVH05_025136 [Phytophthora capsici]|nr:hypothetical protein DVH05_025136 [Phytophthora capsici]